MVILSMFISNIIENTYMKFVEANTIVDLLQYIQSVQAEGKKYDTVVIPFMDALSAISKEL